MKYIVFQRMVSETMKVNNIVLFPNTMVHSEVAKDLMAGSLAGWVVDSAGEVSPMEMKCHGKSDTLGVKSKPTRDTRLLMMNDYGGAYE